MTAMKYYHIILVALATLALFGSVTFTVIRTNAMEKRIRVLETRLGTAENRVASAHQSTFRVLSANPPSGGAPTIAPSSILYGSVAEPVAVTVPGSQGGLEQRLRRVEKELEPHATLIGETSKK
jgi:hypothetical protein